jgi:hypothetical protein
MYVCVCVCVCAGVIYLLHEEYDNHQVVWFSTINNYYRNKKQCLLHLSSEHKLMIVILFVQ